MAAGAEMLAKLAGGDRNFVGGGRGRGCDSRSNGRPGRSHGRATKALLAATEVATVASETLFAAKVAEVAAAAAEVVAATLQYGTIHCDLACFWDSYFPANQFYPEKGAQWPPAPNAQLIHCGSCFPNPVFILEGKHHLGYSLLFTYFSIKSLRRKYCCLL